MYLKQNSLNSKNKIDVKLGWNCWLIFDHVTYTTARGNSSIYSHAKLSEGTIGMIWGCYCMRWLLSFKTTTAASKTAVMA